MRRCLIATPMLVAISLIGCTQDAPQAAEAPRSDVPPSPQEPKVNQDRLCEVTGWQHDIAKEKCTPGQKIVFLPKNWGNEQLPILFAAVNCDLRYSVALTNGAVTCIYSPINVEPEPVAAPLLGPVQIPSTER